MKELKQVVTVDKETADTIQHYLDTEPASKNECLGEDEMFSYTADFGNGIEMDIKLCGVRYNEEEYSNKPWTEAVLFQNGCELCCSDPDEEFFQTWELEYNETKYIAEVVKEEIWLQKKESDEGGSMITEKTFKKAINGLWYGFVTAAGLVDMLNGMGLTIDKSCSKGSGFEGLIGIQGRMSMSILELLEIDCRAGGSTERMNLASEIDQYLCDVRTIYPECSEEDIFPEECYEGLLNVIRNAGISLPWERKGEA